MLNDEQITEMWMTCKQGATLGEQVKHFARAIESAALAGQWQSIETAPQCKGDYFWADLAWGPEDDKTTGKGFRWNNQWYATACFYRMNKKPSFEWIELIVKPTHWKPLPPTPAAQEE